MVHLTEFKDAKYSVTWYNPATGAVFPGRDRSRHPSLADITVSGLKPPFPGDAILHISSRCTTPNMCEPMDSAAAMHTMTSTLGINFYAESPESPATLAQRLELVVIGNSQSNHGSWRCDRHVANNTEDGTPGCILTYVFPTAKPFASVDYDFRRNTRHAHQSISFITAGEERHYPWGLGVLG